MSYALQWIADRWWGVLLFALTLLFFTMLALSGSDFARDPFRRFRRR